MLNREHYFELTSPEVTAYLQEVPYEVSRDRLYTMEDLYGDGTGAPAAPGERYDEKVYRHYRQTGELNRSRLELWARSCHDSAVRRAMERMLAGYDPLKVAGIMGGHALKRTDDYYGKIVHTAKKLTELGWLIITGGGPGAMEAGHLGAWLAGRPESDVKAVLAILEPAPDYAGAAWFDTAWEVRQKYPRVTDRRSLAVPTWLYGHEPANLFATDYAKFFANCVREQLLIDSALGGLIFMPGSAGTLQELFQAAERDHYLAQKYPSPIIFVGRKYWTETVPFYPVVLEMLRSRRFQHLLATLTDDVGEIVDIILDFQNLYPVIKARAEGTLPPAPVQK